MKKTILLVMALLLTISGGVLAQDTTDDTSTGSTVNFFFAACETQAVIDLNGTMLSGFDIYVQVFDQLGGEGTPLTNLTRVSVSGDYQVSPVLTYNNGVTLLLGQFASAEIRIAAEGNPDNSVYSETIDDVQDGCIEPQYGATDTFDAASGDGGSTPIIDPETGLVVSGEVVTSSGIYTPDGGVLNEVFQGPQENIVQIGVRPSEVREEVGVEGRVTDAGLIFAECDAFPGADPGRLFDTDTLTVFWSWFAETPELVREHIAAAQYEVFLSSPYANRQTFPNITVTPVVQREDGNYWVFYIANLGDGFRPGDYRVDYYVTWDRAISDGFENFGPQTETPFLINTCNFTVEVNPFGVETEFNNPTIPLQSGN